MASVTLNKYKYIYSLLQVRKNQRDSMIIVTSLLDEIALLTT